MLSSTFLDELGYRALDQETSNLFYPVISTRHARKRSTLITTNSLRTAVLKLFNADSIVMRGPFFRDPVGWSFWNYPAPHKGTRCQRCDQLVGGLEASRT
jgi:hypothetical protein